VSVHKVHLVFSAPDLLAQAPAIERIDVRGANLPKGKC
jgi:hypothetical protein